MSCTLLQLKAQKGIEIGGHIGASHYFGDLNPDLKISDPGLALGIKFRRNFNHRVCIAAGLDYGRVSGSDQDAVNAFERSRNLDFHSNIYDANFTLEFNFFPYIHGTSDYYYTPYLFGGFSMMRFNPKTTYQEQNYALRDLGTEGQSVGGEYFLMAGSLVYGAGFKWDIDRDYSINVTLSGRRMLTDYIDDVSGEYDTPTSSRDDIASVLANRSEDPNFGTVGTQRGDGRSHDVIYFAGIGIMKYFGRLHCPAISKDIYF